MWRIRVWASVLAVLLVSACAADVLPPPFPVSDSVSAATPSTTLIPTAAPSPTSSIPMAVPSTASIPSAAPSPTSSTPMAVPSTTPIPTAAQPTTPTTPRAVTTTVRPPRESVELAWVPPGPIGSAKAACEPSLTSESATATATDDPNCLPTEAMITPQEWTDAFASRDCAAIGALDSDATEPIYRGLGEACTAVDDNSAARWQAAREALTQAESPSTCLDQLALGLLTDLVEAHEDEPEARIRIVDPTVTLEEACR